MRGVGDGHLLSGYRRSGESVMGNQRERFTGFFFCSWTDAEVVAGLFFLGGEREEIFRTNGMWQKASRGTVSSVE